MEGEKSRFSSKNILIISLSLVVVVLAVVVVFVLQSKTTTVVVGSTSSTSNVIGSPDQQPGVVLNQQQAGSDTGKPVINPLTGMQTGVQCPKDSCLGQVQGAGNCPGSEQAYYEQECYDYPESGTSLADCDKKRTVYYKICGVVQ